MLLLTVHEVRTVRPWFAPEYREVRELLYECWHGENRPLVSDRRLMFLARHHLLLSLTDGHLAVASRHSSNLPWIVDDNGYITRTTLYGENALFVLANAPLLFQGLTGEVQELVFHVPEDRTSRIPLNHEDLN